MFMRDAIIRTAIAWAQTAPICSAAKIEAAMTNHTRMHWVTKVKGRGPVRASIAVRAWLDSLALPPVTAGARGGEKRSPAPTAAVGGDASVDKRSWSPDDSAIRVLHGKRSVVGEHER